jgi:hypothetical protein
VAITQQRREKLTEEHELTPGKWYALGIRDLDGAIDWGGARLLRYDGEGCWSDEDGEVERLWDPFCAAWVAPAAADEFVVQS